MTLIRPFDAPVGVRNPDTRDVAEDSPCIIAVPPPPQRPSRAHPSSMIEIRRVDAARFLADVLLGDAPRSAADIALLEAIVDELVVVWSPSMSTTSRAELVAAIFESDDAIGGIEVEITGEALDDRDVYIEWHVTGRFENVWFLNDDVLVEPSHAEVESVGVLVFEFHGDRVRRINCFYDELDLLERLLRPGGPGVGIDNGHD